MKGRKLTVVKLIELLLLIVFFVGNIQHFSSENSVRFVLNVISISLAWVYLFFDYKKEVNLFFKLFAWSMVIKEALAVVHIAVYENLPIAAFCTTLLYYTCVTLLAFSLNLGKVKSYVLSGILVATSVISLVLSVINSAGNANIFYNGTRALLAVILGIMIYSKYQDKDARGTK